MHSAPIYDDETAMQLSYYLEPADASPTPSIKPFPLLTTFEKHELGFYESDSDWHDKFPVMPLVRNASSREEFWPVMRERCGHTMLVGAVVDKKNVDEDVKPLLRTVHGRSVIVGATVDKLIEVSHFSSFCSITFLMCSKIVTLRPEHSKESYILLNTFREFCKPRHFLGKLITRWNLPQLLLSASVSSSALRKVFPSTTLLMPLISLGLRDGACGARSAPHYWYSYGLDFAARSRF